MNKLNINSASIWLHYTHLKVVGLKGVKWIYLAQNWGPLRDVNTVMILWVTQKIEISLLLAS